MAKKKASPKPTHSERALKLMDELIEKVREQVAENPTGKKAKHSKELLAEHSKLKVELVLVSPIRDRMEQLGITRAKLCRDLGISQASLSMFFSGRQGLSLGVYAVLLMYLDLEIAVKK